MNHKPGDKVEHKGEIYITVSMDGCEGCVCEKMEAKDCIGGCSYHGVIYKKIKDGSFLQRILNSVIGIN